MRVITGKAKGRKLKTLEGNDVRPTTDKVKEAVFSAIQFEIEDARVIDLFSGSGQMGIEALSRGADYAVFTDISKRSLDVTRENLENTGFSQQSKLINADGIEFIKSTAEKFDIAILDPPYRHGLIEKALPYLVKVMNNNGIIICEHEKELKIPEYDGLNIRKEYNYGKISVTLFSVSREE